MQQEQTRAIPEPGDARSLAELEAALRQAGDERLWRQVMQLRGLLAKPGQRAEALHGLGMAALRLGKLEAAATLIRSALRAEPRRLDFLGNLGNVLKDMGRLEQAGACYRQVLAADPSSALAYNNLANTLQERGELAEAVDCYREAIRIQPDYMEAWTNLGNTLQKQKRDEEAVAAYRRAIEINPKWFQAWFNLGAARYEQGRLEEAIECLNKTLSLAPNFVAAYNKLQRIYLDQGRYDEVLALAGPIERHAPGNQMAVACRAFAHLACGDLDRFRFYYGMADLPYVDRLAPPPGYAGLPAFNEALQAEILAHPSLKWIHDTYDTTRRGFVYGLEDDDSPVVCQFRGALLAAIEKFKAGLTPRGDHPFYGRIPGAYSLRLWATVLRGGGYHPPHHHEHNWLSGVYYVKVPKAGAAEDRAGWITFDGFTDLPGLERYRHLVRSVEPVDGLVILFPSYFMHATLPVAGDDLRISLAFDVIPSRPPGRGRPRPPR